MAALVARLRRLERASSHREAAGAQLERAQARRLQPHFIGSFFREAFTLLGGRVVLHFLPPYSPDSNVIERLWKQMHDNVTRNHTHRTIDSLMEAVHEFLHDVQPFPGTQVSLMARAA